MILNINKPKGITSHDVVNVVRKITGEQRIGHAGTLDPFAEGVLIIGASRESTKELGKITHNTEKEYIATMELGKTSTTGDPTGVISPVENPVGLGPLRDYPQLNQIQSILQLFIGETKQTPPQYSAIKTHGKPAYKYARKGQFIQLLPRTITISAIKIEEYNPPFLTIKIVCSAGTYIRTLAEDIAKKLGTGAYLTQLTRTRVGNFCIKDSISLENLHRHLKLSSA